MRQRISPQSYLSRLDDAGHGRVYFFVELRKIPEGQAIPIVVITSNELTHADRLHLNGGVKKTNQQEISRPEWFS
jgi:hypothetical protein